MNAREIISKIIVARAGCLTHTAEAIADEILTRLLGAQVETLSPTDLRHDMLMASILALNGQHADVQRRVFVSDLNNRLLAREGKEVEVAE